MTCCFMSDKMEREMKGGFGEIFLMVCTKI